MSVYLLVILAWLGVFGGAEQNTTPTDDGGIVWANDGAGNMPPIPK